MIIVQNQHEGLVGLQGAKMLADWPDILSLYDIVRRFRNWLGAVVPDYDLGDAQLQYAPDTFPGALGAGIIAQYRTNSLEGHLFVRNWLTRHLLSNHCSKLAAPKAGLRSAPR